MAQHPSFTRYFLGISLPEPENTFFMQIRRQYHPEHRLTSPPHITIKPPFQMPNKSYLLEKLRKIAKNLDPFTISFTMIGSFRQPKYGTVFLEPQKSEQLKVIERTLSENIAFMPEVKGFHPHLTLAQHVAHENIPQVKRELRALNLKLELPVTALTLFSQSEMGLWEVEAVFPFGVDNTHTNQKRLSDDDRV
jgi:2'-5' RNA ligase